MQPDLGPKLWPADFEPIEEPTVTNVVGDQGAVVEEEVDEEEDWEDEEEEDEDWYDEDEEDEDDDESPEDGI